jgi:hypothetical protein
LFFLCFRSQLGHWCYRALSSKQNPDFVLILNSLSLTPSLSLSIKSQALFIENKQLSLPLLGFFYLHRPSIFAASNSLFGCMSVPRSNNEGWQQHHQEEQGIFHPWTFTELCILKLIVLFCFSVLQCGGVP